MPIYIYYIVIRISSSDGGRIVCIVYFVTDFRISSVTHVQGNILQFLSLDTRNCYRRRQPVCVD